MIIAIAFATLQVVIASNQSAQSRGPGRSDEELGVTAVRAEMQKLAALIGVFDLSATEKGTDGSSFNESGTRRCRWALGRTTIECEDERTLIDAAGRYQQLPRHRRSMRVLRWNAADRRYEQVEMGMSGAPFVRALMFDPDRLTISYHSVVESQSMKVTLDNASTLTIATDRHDLVQQLRSRTTDFSEEYRETAMRRTVAIREANQRYRDAWLTNDAAAVMSTLAPGAVILPSGMAAIAGEAAIRAFWFPSTGPATTVTAMDLEVDDILEADDVAVVRGTGTLSFTMAFQDGRTQSATQRSWYVNVLQRQSDGRWLIASRAWSDLRPPSR
jgi:uncharacterized protein (TIGR02246 family)